MNISKKLLSELPVLPDGTVKGDFTFAERNIKMVRMAIGDRLYQMFHLNFTMENDAINYILWKHGKQTN